jgi:hypothetical protein
MNTLMQLHRTNDSQWTACRAAGAPQGAGPGASAMALAARKQQVPIKVAANCSAWRATTWERCF